MNKVVRLSKLFCNKYDSSPAIYLSNDTNITYKNLKAVCQHINKLIRQKLGNDSLTVMVYLPQTAQSLMINLAILSEFTCIPINPNLSVAQIESVAHILQPDLIIVDDMFIDLINKVTQNLAVNICTLQLDIANVDRSYGQQNCQPDDKEDVSIPAASINWVKFGNTDNILKKQSYSDYSLILSTSGTTGQPKLVALTWAQLMAAAATINDTLRLTAKDTVLHALPMYHIGAFVDLLLVPLLSGGSIVVKKVDDTADIINSLCSKVSSNSTVELGASKESGYQVTWYQCVPAMLTDLIRKNDARLIGTLDFIRVVSAPLPQTLSDEFTAKFNIPLIPMYGMTETAGQITSCERSSCEYSSCEHNSRQCKQNSVGKGASVSIRIVDEQGTTVTNTTQGEVCVSGTQVIEQYLYGMPQSQSHIKIESDYWLKTGDLGYLDDEGFLFITGRIKEIINRGGEKIAIQAIDSVMLAHKMIAECATFAIYHSTLGEEVALAVVPSVDKKLINQTAVIKDITQFAAKNLPAIQQPKAIYLVDSLPKTGSGKIQRHVLSNTYSNNHIKNNSLENNEPNSLDDITLNDITLNEPYQADANIVAEVKQIWCNILKVNTIAADDNFFLLGGDSLLAVTLIDKLISRYPALSVDDVIDLYDNPTVAEFAAALQLKLKTASLETANQRRDKSLSKMTEHSNDNVQNDITTGTLVEPNVQLDDTVSKGLRAFLTAWGGERVDKNGYIIVKNRHGKQPPLFWCAQSYQDYNNLAQQLPDNLPIYGMRSLYRIQKPEDRDNVTLAKYYAEAILSLDINEPYYLGGFCEGGTIALEIAKHLKQQGKTTALLAIQDKFVDYNQVVAARTALFWSNNVKRNKPLDNYIKNLNSPLSQDFPRHGSYFSDFFFPEYNWLSMPNQSLSLYCYDCMHSQLNSDHVTVFANDLVYEMAQAHKGLPSKHQLSSDNSLALTDYHQLAYNIKVKAPRLVSKRKGTTTISVVLKNLADLPIQPTKESGITLSAKWLNHNGEFRRVAGVIVIEKPIASGEKKQFSMQIIIPNKASIKFYQLRINLVQEGFYWLDEKGLTGVTQSVVIY